MTSETRAPVFDYLCSYKEQLRGETPPRSTASFRVAPMIMSIRRFPSGGEVNFIPAGDQRDHARYGENVNNFDWNEFYREWNGAQFLEFFRGKLKTSADIVLVDSRTGITDIGGVCTLQLPDIVVLVFGFNEQNIAGTKQIARALSKESPDQEKFGRKPELLILPPRKELSEIPRLRLWEREAANRLGEYVPTQIVNEYGGPLGYIRKAAIQYIGYFNYGEDLAVESEEGVELRTAYPTLAKTLIGPREPHEKKVAPARKTYSWLWMGVGVGGAVATLTVFAIQGPLKFAAYWAYALALAGGFYGGVSWFGKKHLSQSAKETLTLWLWGEYESSWSHHFCNQFDAVFGSKHLSWRCFIRSSLASILAVLLLYVLLATILGILESGNRAAGELSLLQAILFGSVINVIPDYVSLLETRWLLKRFERINSFVGQLGVLAADALFTGAIIWLAINGFQLLRGDDPLAAIEMLALFSVFSLFFYSTFLTSAWAWVYFVSTWSMRLFSRSRLIHALDTESKPEA